MFSSFSFINHLLSVYQNTKPWQNIPSERWWFSGETEQLESTLSLGVYLCQPEYVSWVFAEITAVTIFYAMNMASFKTQYKFEVQKMYSDSHVLKWVNPTDSCLTVCALNACNIEKIPVFRLNPCISSQLNFSTSMSYRISGQTVCHTTPSTPLMWRLWSPKVVGTLITHLLDQDHTFRMIWIFYLSALEIYKATRTLVSIP